MHRLTILFHNIVCNINQVVDWANSICSQTSLHPFWRRSDFYIFYDTRAVARAQISIFYFYTDIVMCIFCVTGRCDNRRFKLLIEGCCSFSCNTDHAVAVYTVGCNLILKYDVISSQCFDCISTNFCILRENIDTVFRSLRVHIGIASQLFDGTHHTVGLYTTQFSFFNLNSAFYHLSVMASGNTSAVKNNGNLISYFYIRSTCNNLSHLASHIDLTHDQFICIRMSFDFLNLADYNLVQICIQLFKAFYFCSGQSHCICIFLCRYIKIRHIHFNP